ncbi:MAG: LytTR family transcriptional regulator [Prevotella sp.]|nr:LytTR family transcriptional regulator [Prevotella sp.]
MRKHVVLTIKNKSEIIFLTLDSILYFQADGNYCNVFFADGSVLSTLTYQRAEIARMMDEQLPEDVRKDFMLLGKSYLINKAYVLRVQPSRQLLTFRVNRFGTAKKISIKATTSALNLLIKQIGECPSGEE